ncbi:hypothetical protein LCGC14_0123880 [marine sediment metagenome]|uniref:Uncharacterized protein n=1 Tax=marine sediment metagenome TaxID=412755 RepID=A0A0F9V9D2_9ZZZZ
MVICVIRICLFVASLIALGWGGYVLVEGLNHDLAAGAGGGAMIGGALVALAILTHSCKPAPKPDGHQNQ